MEAEVTVAAMLRLFARFRYACPADEGPSPLQVQVLLTTAETQLRQVDEAIAALGPEPDAATAADLQQLRERLEENIALTRDVLAGYAPQAARATERPRPAAAAVPDFTEDLGPAGTPGAVDHGFQVARLQQVLAAAGFACPVSTRYDGPTAAAVRAWQEQQGLPGTGILDQASRARLNGRDG